MSAGFFPPLPPRPDDDADPMGYLDPSVRQEARESWELRAVQWRAVEIAEAVFGGHVAPRVVESRGAQGFRAILELEVPFVDLDTHRSAEAVFVASSRRDEVLARSPMLVLFSPRPDVRAADGAPEVTDTPGLP